LFRDIFGLGANCHVQAVTAHIAGVHRFLHHIVDKYRLASSLPGNWLLGASSKARDIFVLTHDLSAN